MRWGNSVVFAVALLLAGQTARAQASPEAKGVRTVGVVKSIPVVPSRSPPIAAKP